MCVQHIPSLVAAAKTKVRLGDLGNPVDDELGDSMLACDQEVGWGGGACTYCTCA